MPTWGYFLCSKPRKRATKCHIAFQSTKPIKHPLDDLHPQQD
ncbi:hypothetical protein RISK_005491 [Rhodopirellula islandica]|uniref:Uncharacterized protein n=1 Tax=Rhodopirellula islandica TaxID=595434 RepID=A0A0J1B6K6_RHOIS|nr:hypothetical protein RISK_005491 [Rhodopirellula islandica]